jgi:hypothetical protein
MREDRRLRRSITAAGIALLVVLTGSAVTRSASPDPSASSPSPAPSATASPSNVIDVCSEPVVIADSPRAVPRELVGLRIAGFPPDSQVAVQIGVEGETPRQIAVALLDRQGASSFEVKVPTWLPFGDARLTVTTDDGRCSFGVCLVIVGSKARIAIDDDTVVPGQRVTITAGGFEPGHSISIMLDGDAFDALSEGRHLGGAVANELGTLRARVRIPRDVRLGAHFLTANGSSFGELSDLILTVDITVVAGGTMPPTDTE